MSFKGACKDAWRSFTSQLEVALDATQESTQFMKHVFVIQCCVGDSTMLSTEMQDNVAVTIKRLTGSCLHDFNRLAQQMTQERLSLSLTLEQ